MTKKAKTKKYVNLTEGTTGFVESVLFGLHNKNKKVRKNLVCQYKKEIWFSFKFWEKIVKTQWLHILQAGAVRWASSVVEKIKLLETVVVAPVLLYKIKGSLEITPI